jgi:DNA-binding response OmpR family regulator
MSNPFAFVIEDDEEIARFISLVLHEVDFVTEIIHNGRIALERLADVAPDVVVLDLNIPSVSGVEVLRQIRANPSLAKTKVIVVSANPHMMDYAYEMADLVLQKPISFDQLRDLVRRLLE